MDYEQKEQAIRAEMAMDKSIDQFKQEVIKAIKSEIRRSKYEYHCIEGLKKAIEIIKNK